jgi:jumonji domain-containing protein 7
MFITESVYQNAMYEPNPTTNKLELKPLGSSTPWIPVNPLEPDFARFPRFANACPVIVTVKEGDMLYLPGTLSIEYVQLSN